MPPNITKESKNVTKENNYILNKLEECVINLISCIFLDPLQNLCPTITRSYKEKDLQRPLFGAEVGKLPAEIMIKLLAAIILFLKPKMNCLYPHILSLNELFLYFYKLAIIDFSVLLHKSIAEYPITESVYNCCFTILSIKTIPHKSLFRALICV